MIDRLFVTVVDALLSPFLSMGKLLMELLDRVLAIPAFQRLLAMYLILLGLAVGAYFLIFPFYAYWGEEVNATAIDIWDWLNWFMGAGGVLAVWVTFHGKRLLDLDDGGDTWRRVSAAVRFYLTLVLTMATLNNWFENRWGGGAEGLVWIVVDIGFFIIMLDVGVRLWKAEHLNEPQEADA